MKSLESDELKLKVLKIDSITQYIAEICSQIEYYTMGQFVINYTGHRENMAFGWNEKCVSVKLKYMLSQENGLYQKIIVLLTGRD